MSGGEIARNVGGVATHDGSDHQYRMVIESRYKYMAFHRRHLGYLGVVEWVWVSVYAAYLGSLYFFTDKAPSHINVAFMATGLVSSYLATKVSFGKGAVDRNTVLAVAIINVVLGAFLFQSVFVMNSLLSEDMRMHVVLARGLVAKFAPPKADRDAIIAMFERYRHNLQRFEGGILLSGTILLFLASVNAYFIYKDSKDNARDEAALKHRQEERKKKDEGIKMVMEATRKPDPGPADEQAAGDDEAEARGAEEKDAIAAEAAGARKPSKYRRARKDI